MASLRAQKALANMLENGGVASTAMLKAGYSPNTAKVPSKLTSSKGFQALLKKHLPDSLLAKVHKEGLSAFKFETQLTGKGESEIVKVPDFSTRHKYLDTGYKVKKLYPVDSNAQTNNVLVINLSGQSSTRYGTDNPVALAS